MDPKIIAFYLPQYHPIKENNVWFGEGFTEWTNVGNAKPLFKGHYQPKVPANLGYYDLRLPEVRQRQAELAKEAGISAFCYYHYWFGNGKQLMDMPLKEVIRLGEPDFPFCLCWANHSFYRKSWNPNTKSIDQALLLEQLYPGEEDIKAHFYSLLPAFKDERYYKIDDKLVFSIYDSRGFHDFDNFKKIWNQLAEKEGLSPFFFIAYSSSLNGIDNEPFTLYDSVILSLIDHVVYKGNESRVKRVLYRLRSKISEILHKPLLLANYGKVYRHLLDPIEKRVEYIPLLFPNWDYTARRGTGGLILYNSEPNFFYLHAKEAMDMIRNKPKGRQILFLKSWNEWGEGNYMEPDLRYGKKYIEALRKAIDDVEQW